ncbi:LOB domain-containing protein 4-like [Momordica charantia]|uniref:LOB domain-containing protein 4-like n=1 Tax=Momordica charantia TaxID=3673 RepID=A0A6J1C1R5_MOMCH|nr:LOB domain-containing protein 4-like [Momordica charantia]
MTIKGGTSQACAACKYQRRRCSKDCALAPYFPADQPKMFQNAHRLFGVCNIMKILRQVHPSQKDETMTSIIYESNMRARFPVHGCCGVIWHLHYQVQQAADELRQVKTRLAMVKEQFQNQMNNNVVGGGPLEGIVDASYPIYTQQQPQYNGGLMVNQMTGDGSDFFGNGNNGGIYEDDNNGLMLKELRIQQHYNDNYGINISNVESMLMQSNLIPTVQGYPLQQEMEISHDYDEIPFDTIADDRQSYIESKEGCDSSAESTFKDVSESSAEYVSRIELKNAAACFSLTSHVK